LKHCNIESFLNQSSSGGLNKQTWTGDIHLHPTVYRQVVIIAERHYYW